MKYCSINGEQQSLISVSDRGFAYGDGSFTTAKIVNGKIDLLDAHLNRLLSTCRFLNINFLTIKQLKTQLTAVAEAYSLAVLKVVITAGSGGRGYARDPSTKPNIIIMVYDVPSYYSHWQQQGITLGISRKKMGINPMLAGFKHLNRLEQVFFKNELAQRTEDDLIITNINNHMIEASSANLFWQYRGDWYTPDLSLSGVAGLMRERVLAVIPNVKIVKAAVDILDQLDAIFICNAIMGIVPVKQLNLTKTTRTLTMASVLCIQKELSIHLLEQPTHD